MDSQIGTHQSSVLKQQQKKTLGPFTYSPTNEIGTFEPHTHRKQIVLEKSKGMVGFITAMDSRLKVVLIAASQMQTIQ